MLRPEARADGHSPTCGIRWKPSGWVAYLKRPDCLYWYVTPPPDASVGNQVGRLIPSPFRALGALWPIRRCATGVAAINTANVCVI